MSHDFTQAIIEWQAGAPNAQEKFQLVIYDHLRQLASKQKQKMAKKHGEHNLEDNINATTALVHEVFIKIQQGSTEYLSNRRDFALLVSKSVHNILVDHARKSASQKRDADITNIDSKNSLIDESHDPDNKLLDLSAAIEAMEVSFPRQAQTMQLKYFGGLLVKEIADLLNISVSSAEKDIAFAKSWLKMRLS
ncbi:ECF-type sigma factor [Pseudoalteromonas sp. SS15]|uniref:ECF-type sigma factor n=1 Tax=Pseudoalteromonas sp. SS15 TaxID=3139393 RepID=UPI003BAA45BE